MEVDGKEFLRNIALEQEKEALMREQKRLEALKRESVIRKTQETQESAFVDFSSKTSNPYEKIDEEPVISDLMLDQDDSEKNKRRYILLGIGLILVFVITILVIRLVSNNDTQERLENINPETKGISADSILDKIDTNEEYQKIIDKNKALEEAQQSDTSKQNNLNEIVVPENTVDNTPLVIDKPKLKEEPQRDLFGLSKEEMASTSKKEEEIAKPVPVTKPVTKPVENLQKVVTKPIPQKTQPLAETTEKATGVSGYYIQVGAFTKEPSATLLSEIQKKGYSYNVHKMDIKGTIYNKVLIGAYPTRELATKDLEKVRKDFNNKNAYILKF